MNKRKKGSLYENRAAEFLERNSYEILEKIIMADMEK